MKYRMSVVTMLPQQEPVKQAGFSLVELSIVLIILGLLTGGILGGQSLIAAAELRSIGKEYEQWQMAINAFKEKYNAIPGDFNMAERFWGDGDATGETWDGNGDGIVDYGSNPSEESELFTFWQHMALAGLINGEYTGIAGSATYEDSTIGVNVPGSKFGGGGWATWNADLGSIYTTDWYEVDMGNALQVGAKMADNEYGGPLLKPEDAWNIDTKFDDGMPGKGKIIGKYWDDLCSDATAEDDFDSDYKLGDSSVQCSLAFRQAF
jgi:prepilin-type N-terminal cleavage/methylation domain-containing protein